MKKANQKPAWWQLYLLIPVMFLLFAGEQVLPLPGVSKEISDILIIVLIFGSMLIWAWANRGQLDEDYMARHPVENSLKITVYEPASQQAKNRTLSHGALLPVSPEASNMRGSVGREEVERAK